VEKGGVSRVSPHPLRGAYLQVTAQTKLPNRFDFTAITSNNYGLEYVQFDANYDVGASFTASLGAHLIFSLQLHALWPLAAGLPTQMIDNNDDASSNQYPAKLLTQVSKMPVHDEHA
jgi:hypothetical protein